MKKGSASKSDRAGIPTSPDVDYPQERKERYEKALKQSQSPLYKRVIPPPRDGNPGMSFIEITESQIVPAGATIQNVAAQRPKQVEEETAKDTTLSSQLGRHERLFSILSAHSDIDHPICVECSSMLLTSLNAKLVAATKERDAYASFLKQLQQATNKHKDSEAGAKKDLAALQKDEQTAFENLLDLEEQKKQLEEELCKLEEEEKELEIEEQQFWLSRNAFDEQEHALQVELASLHQKYEHDQKQHEKLQRTNVYNDTFFISHDGNFGTINGLRLGRLPNINVEWSEINAAWGQTLLLLQTLAERLSFSFQGYRLRPLGSTSRIEKLEYPQQPSGSRNPNVRSNTSVTPTRVTALELYSSGAALNRVFQSRKFDQAMEAFLDCLSQLGKHVEKTSAARDTGRTSAAHNASSTSMRLPYVIEADKIWNRDRPEEVYSIKLGVGFAVDESFTKACKYVLTCCKYLLAHVSNLDSSRPT